MKKNVWVLTTVLWMVLASPCGNLWAETAGPVQAGSAASVEGEVKATTPPEKSTHSLKNGDKIFMGDKIETGADGQLQILLLDETVFTLGPLSTITIDEFVYDPENVENKPSMVKGILRAVSGKVAQQNPEDVPADFSDDSKNSANAAGQGAEGASFSKAQEDALKLAELMSAKDQAQRATDNAQR
jgi:hypothetical protein